MPRSSVLIVCLYMEAARKRPYGGKDIRSPLILEDARSDRYELMGAAPVDPCHRLSPVLSEDSLNLAPVAGDGWGREYRGDTAEA